MRPRTACTPAATLLFVLGLSAAASAQPGRVGGVVRDEDGQPIKGATVIAENREINSSFTATTDDRGRFIIIGLRSGVWRFVAQAPGYAPEAGEVPIRSVGALNPPITFALRRTAPETLGALSNISNRELQESLGRADKLFAEGRWNDAVRAYRRVLERAPVLTSIHLQIAAAHRGRGDLPAAIAAYEELLKLDEDNPQATIGIALAQMERGDLPAAEATLTAAAASTSEAELPYRLGEVKRRQGDSAAAADWYARAAAADPSWGKPLYELGDLALSAGDTTSAARYLEQVIAVDPLSPEADRARIALEGLNK
jgi:tetratricopeptide (TPR) repeat protein